MKLINSILEALLMPKQNDFLNRDRSNGQNVHGLILIPIPEKPNYEGRRQNDFTGR
jgi:hypothetical protein